MSEDADATEHILAEARRSLERAIADLQGAQGQHLSWEDEARESPHGDTGPNPRLRAPESIHAPAHAHAPQQAPSAPRLAPVQPATAQHQTPAPAQAPTPTPTPASDSDDIFEQTGPVKSISHLDPRSPVNFGFGPLN